MVDAFSVAIMQTIRDGSWDTAWRGIFPGAYTFEQNCSVSYPHLDKLSGYIRNGVIRIGYQPYVPFFFYNETTRVVSGPEFDFGNLLVKILSEHYKIPLRADWVYVGHETDFEGDLYRGLQAGKYDVILSTLAHTDLREKKMVFSCTYFAEYTSFLRTALHPERKIETLAEVNHPNVKIAFVRGTVAEKHVRHMAPNATFVEFKQWTDGVNEVHLVGWDDGTLAHYVRTVQCQPVPCHMLNISRDQLTEGTFNGVAVLLPSDQSQLIVGIVLGILGIFLFITFLTFILVVAITILRFVRQRRNYDGI